MNAEKTQSLTSRLLGAASLQNVSLTLLTFGLLMGAGLAAANAAEPTNTPAVYDANDLKVAASSGDNAMAVTKSGGTGGNFLRVDTNAADDFITFDVNVPSTQDYQVVVRVHKNKSRGIFQLAIDNGKGFVNLGAAQDLYANEPGFGDVDVGSVTLAAGTRQFRFTVTGKNASAADFQLSFDTITITPKGGKTARP